MTDLSSWLIENSRQRDHTTSLVRETSFPAIYSCDAGPY
jgi:hypothetical protein